MEIELGRVKALGRPRVWIGSQPIGRKAWGSRRAEELFFLLMNHPSGLTKDEIVERLFPEADGEEGNTLFHSTLYRCRGALGKQSVVWEDHCYRILNIDQWRYDVARFRELLNRARQMPDNGLETERVRRDALELYEGDYLEGWGSQWCEPIRERLRQLYVTAAVAVAKSRLDSDLPAEALDLYQLAVAKDYYSEPAQKGVMSCLLATGDRLAAIRHYVELVRRLQEDVPPEARSDIPALAQDMLGTSIRALLAVTRGLGAEMTQASDLDMADALTAQDHGRYKRFTQVSNAVIDDVLPGLSATAWKLLTVLLRQAASWDADIQEVGQEQLGGLSYAELKERTGISSARAIARALRELRDGGYIITTRPSNTDARRGKQSLFYSLKAEFRVKASRW